MSTSLLLRRCLPCLRTTRVLRQRPLAINHGQTQRFSRTRIWGDYEIETGEVDTKASSAGNFGKSNSLPFYQCSILSRKPSLFTSGSFVLPHLRWDLGNKPLLLILFVTPPLASLLDEGSSFFNHILGRLFSRLEVDREFDVLAAVVDSIPHAPVQHLKAIEVDIPGSIDRGFDGISLLLCDSHVAAPDLWSPRQEKHEQDSMDIQQRSTISFLYGPPERWRTWAAGRFPPRIYTTQSVELPLANTMFYNAQTSTMFAQRWTVVQNGEDDSKFDCIKQMPLIQQTLDMTKHVGEVDLDVYLPTIPITVPRRITVAMGNIIRRIQTGDDPEDQAPASEELEKSIDGYFKRLGSPEEQVGIWALVTPQENWASQPQSTRDKILWSDIENGAHLHQVLSGGGGWGAKQGLLSLDPHSTYSRSEQASQLLISDDTDLEAEKLALFGQLVKPGDVVQFFVHRPSVNKSHSDLPELRHTQILFDPVHGPRTTIFGTIPSTMDAMPQPRSTPASAHASSVHIVIHTHFGALSEKGISVTLTTHNAAAPTSTAPLGLQHVGPVVTTKLDIPNARFAWLPTQAMWFKQLTSLLALVQARRAQGRIRRVVLDEGPKEDRGFGNARFWMVPRLPPASLSPARPADNEPFEEPARPGVFPRERQTEQQEEEEPEPSFRILKVDSKAYEKRPRSDEEMKKVRARERARARRYDELDAPLSWEESRVGFVDTRKERRAKVRAEKAEKAVKAGKLFRGKR